MEEKTTAETSAEVTEEDQSITPEEAKDAEKLARKAHLREVKKILLGKYAPMEDGRICASGNGWITPQGINDGARATIFFGVKQKRFVYKTKLKTSKQALFKAAAAMREIGRAWYRETAPEACASYVRSVLFRPVVLRFNPCEGKENVLELYAYCGRSPLAFLSIRRVVSRFDKALPDEIVRS